MYFGFIIVALGILILFRILAFLNKRLPFSKEFKHYSGYLLPVLEFVVWLGFLAWCMRIIYEAGAFMTLIVIGVVVLLFIVPGWFLVRDFLYGMLLKIQRKIEVGNKIAVGELKGLVIQTDYFTFDIKREDGNIDTIPYNKIREKVISKNGANSQLEKQLLTFSISANSDVNKIIPQLKSTLINAPWVAASQEPIIHKVVEAAGKNVIEVFVYLIRKEHVDNVKEYVSKNLIDAIE